MLGVSERMRQGVEGKGVGGLKRTDFRCSDDDVLIPKCRNIAGLTPRLERNGMEKDAR